MRSGRPNPASQGHPLDQVLPKGAQAVDVKIDGHKVRLTHPDKVLYPNSGFRKRNIFEYYSLISSVLLPHIKNRALTIKRYPEGAAGRPIYSKEAPSFLPEWFKRVTVNRKHEKLGKKDITWPIYTDTASLLWVANQDAPEIHLFLSRVDDFDRPDCMLFDMDPGPGTNLVDCAWAALQLRDHLAQAGLRCFPKTSGQKGIHVYVPLHTPVTFAQTGDYSHAVARSLEQRFPKKLTSTMAKTARNGKMYIDWAQNNADKTTVAVYSLRTFDPPGVSTPLRWEELELAFKSGKTSGLIFTPAQVLERVKKYGDLFAEVLTLRQSLPDAGDKARMLPAALIRATPRRAVKNLAEYRRKRDFTKTAEPAGAAGDPGKEPRFVIQKHAASHLHYDFRLEMDGVLKSWAVPKGPSTDPAVKRLAVHVEDHPINYLNFEGIIPAGEYGGGTVMVWDIGTYVNLTPDKKGGVIPIEKGLGLGHIDFWLKGKKLNGAWSLILVDREDGRRWLLKKMEDHVRPASKNPVEELLTSAKSGRSLEQIKTDAGSAVWHSDR